MIDAGQVNILLGTDEEPFNLFTGEVKAYERKLQLDKGYTERLIHWCSPKGKELKLYFRRFVSFEKKELFSIQIKLNRLIFLVR